MESALNFKQGLAASSEGEHGFIVQSSVGSIFYTGQPNFRTMFGKKEHSTLLVFHPIAIFKTDQLRSACDGESILLCS